MVSPLRAGIPMRGVAPETHHRVSPLRAGIPMRGLPPEWDEPVSRRLKVERDNQQQHEIIEDNSSPTRMTRFSACACAHTHLRKASLHVLCFSMKTRDHRWRKRSNLRCSSSMPLPSS